MRFPNPQNAFERRMNAIVPQISVPLDEDALAAIQAIAVASQQQVALVLKGALEAQGLDVEAGWRVDLRAGIASRPATPDEADTLLLSAPAVGDTKTK